MSQSKFFFLTLNIQSLSTSFSPHFGVIFHSHGPHFRLVLKNREDQVLCTGVLAVCTWLQAVGRRDDRENAKIDQSGS